MTARGDEWCAASHVERLGFQFYLPQILLPNSEGEYTLRRFLFPGYIFVMIRAGWEYLVGVKGLRRLLMHDERPVPIPRGEIENIRSMEDARGFVLLMRPAVGSVVVVGSGALSGQSCKVTGSRADQCEVQLSMMGRNVSTVLNARALRAA